MATFIISDTHFNHRNIIGFGRDFATVEEHDEKLIENWNSVVRSGDIVWHLGDVFLNSTPESIDAILRRLNGNKKLVLGNHDTWERVKQYMNHFSTILSSAEIRGFCNKNVLLTHIPVHESQLERWDLNIHGHVHANTIPDARYINASCEAINCTPAPFLDLIGCHTSLEVKK